MKDIHDTVVVWDEQVKGETMAAMVAVGAAGILSSTVKYDEART